MKRLAVIVAGAAGIACCLPAAPTMAAAGNATANLSAPLVSVASTSGQSLNMSISASKGSSGTTLAVRLEHKNSKSDEVHTWSFPLANTGLTYSNPKGKLATGNKLGQYGELSITFRKVSSSTKSCTGFNGATKVTTTVLTFKGMINFAARDDTKASPWGSVKKGSSSSPYNFGKKKGVYITTTNGACNAKITNNTKCFELWSWNASRQSASGIANFEGDRRGSVSTITAFSESLLSSPKNSARIDSTTVGAPAPQFNGNANPNTLHVSTSSGTAASGGGTMAATQNGANNPAGKCTKSDGSTAHETATFWPAKWTNDSQKLTVMQAIGGAFSVPDNSDGYFQHFTFS
jgi:hypothetical protein